MKNAYNIIIGIAMLVAVASGCILNSNKYYYGLKEIPKEFYEANDSDYAVKYAFGFGSAFAGGTAAFGIGLLVLGIRNRKKGTTT